MKQWMIFMLLLAIQLTNSSSKTHVDLFDECEEWAKRGDCSGKNRILYSEMILTSVYFHILLQYNNVFFRSLFR